MVGVEDVLSRQEHKGNPVRTSDRTTAAKANGQPATSASKMDDQETCKDQRSFRTNNTNVNTSANTSLSQALLRATPFRPVMYMGQKVGQRCKDYILLIVFVLALIKIFLMAYNKSRADAKKTMQCENNDTTHRKTKHEQHSSRMISPITEVSSSRSVGDIEMASHKSTESYEHGVGITVRDSVMKAEPSNNKIQADMRNTKYDTRKTVDLERYEYTSRQKARNEMQRQVYNVVFQRCSLPNTLNSRTPSKLKSWENLLNGLNCRPTMGTLLNKSPEFSINSIVHKNTEQLEDKTIASSSTDCKASESTDISKIFKVQSMDIMPLIRSHTCRARPFHSVGETVRGITCAHQTTCKLSSKKEDTTETSKQQSHVSALRESNTALSCEISHPSSDHSLQKKKTHLDKDNQTEGSSQHPMMLTRESIEMKSKDSISDGSGASESSSYTSDTDEEGFEQVYRIATTGTKPVRERTRNEGSSETVHQNYILSSGPTLEAWQSATTNPHCATVTSSAYELQTQCNHVSNFIKEPVEHTNIPTGPRRSRSWGILIAHAQENPLMNEMMARKQWLNGQGNSEIVTLSPLELLSRNDQYFENILVHYARRRSLRIYGTELRQYKGCGSLPLEQLSRGNQKTAPPMSMAILGNAKKSTKTRACRKPSGHRRSKRRTRKRRIEGKISKQGIKLNHDDVLQCNKIPHELVANTFPPPTEIKQPQINVAEVKTSEQFPGRVAQALRRFKNNICEVMHLSFTPVTYTVPKLQMTSANTKEQRTSETDSNNIVPGACEKSDCKKNDTSFKVLTINAKEKITPREDCQPLMTTANGCQSSDLYEDTTSSKDVRTTDAKGIVTGVYLGNGVASNESEEQQDSTANTNSSSSEGGTQGRTQSFQENTTQNGSLGLEGLPENKETEIVPSDSLGSSKDDQEPAQNDEMNKAMNASNAKDEQNVDVPKMILETANAADMPKWTMESDDCINKDSNGQNNNSESSDSNNHVPLNAELEKRDEFYDKHQKQNQVPDDCRSTGSIITEIVAQEHGVVMCEIIEETAKPIDNIDDIKNDIEDLLQASSLNVECSSEAEPSSAFGHLEKEENDVFVSDAITRGDGFHEFMSQANVAEIDHSNSSVSEIALKPTISDTDETFYDSNQTNSELNLAEPQTYEKTLSVENLNGTSKTQEDSALLKNNPKEISKVGSALLSTGNYTRTDKKHQVKENMQEHNIKESNTEEREDEIYQLAKISEICNISAIQLKDSDSKLTEIKALEHKPNETICKDGQSNESLYSANSGHSPPISKSSSEEEYFSCSPGNQESPPPPGYYIRESIFAIGKLTKKEEYDNEKLTPEMVAAKMFQLCGSGSATKSEIFELIEKERQRKVQEERVQKTKLKSCQQLERITLDDFRRENSYKHLIFYKSMSNGISNVCLGLLDALENSRKNSPFMIHPKEMILVSAESLACLNCGAEGEDESLTSTPVSQTVLDHVAIDDAMAITQRSSRKEKIVKSVRTVVISGALVYLAYRIVIKKMKV